MSSISTNDPIDRMFRAVPLGTTSIDLNSAEEVVFEHAGCSTGTVQIARKSGATGTWVVTVERSNDGSTFVALDTPTTYNTFGVQAALSLDTRFTRVRVTTPQGADADAVITMFARP